MDIPFVMSLNIRFCWSYLGPLSSLNTWFFFRGPSVLVSQSVVWFLNSRRKKKLEVVEEFIPETLESSQDPLNLWWDLSGRVKYEVFRKSMDNRVTRKSCWDTYFLKINGGKNFVSIHIDWKILQFPKRVQYSIVYEFDLRVRTKISSSSHTQKKKKNWCTITTLYFWTRVQYFLRSDSVPGRVPKGSGVRGRDLLLW